MAQFEISETVNNILSGHVGTAQELVGNVTETTSGLAATGAGLLKPPDRRDAPGDAPDAAGAPSQQRQFNPFSLVEARGAVAMASMLIQIAEEAEGDGLDVAISTTAFLGELLGEASGLVGDLGGALTDAASARANEIVSEVGAELLGLVGVRQHALTLFIIHYPPAYEKIKFAPLDQREPNLVSRAGSRTTPEENPLNFWREDAQLNEHHGRWHDVNPLGGRPGSTPSGDPMVNRNGELFTYMHLQMLARYDAERLGVGLDRVVPFGHDPDGYNATIPEGYNPGRIVGKLLDGNFVTYRARPDGEQITDLSAGEGGIPPESKVEDLEEFREGLRKAAHQGHYEVDGNPKVSSDNLGNTIEASNATVSFEKYGNLHGDGHAHFAFFDDNQGPAGGLMVDLSATCRDPIFWRWHKHVDTIIQIWRKRLGEQEPHDFAKDAPKVTVRSEDIIVCEKKGLPVDVDDGKLGASAFGYSKVATDNRWDTDFSSDSAAVTLSKGTKDKKVTVTTTAELSTEMRKRTIHPLNPETMKAEPEDITYLSHDDFFYFVRLQNNSEQAQTVTVRIFLAPESWVEDSTAWIEMDRFLHELKGGERAVVFRPARLSAVIRKPAIGHEELEGTKPREPAEVWCDCGWPYNLLLPRGTEEGLDFRLLVMVSSDDLATDETGKKCTSISYCGLRDKKYPDERPMGYPFDRPLPDSIDSIIDKHDNWASRNIKIRCRKLTA